MGEAAMEHMRQLLYRIRPEHRALVLHLTRYEHVHVSQIPPEERDSHTFDVELQLGRRINVLLNALPAPLLFEFNARWTHWLSDPENLTEKARVLLLAARFRGALNWKVAQLIAHLMIDKNQIK